MNAYILNQYTPAAMQPELIDHRHSFTRPTNNASHFVGAYTCGITRDALARKLRQYSANKSGDGYPLALAQFVKNPSATGFLIEQAVLPSIARRGLAIGMNIFDEMETVASSSIFPEYKLDSKRTIYCPLEPNPRGIDSIVVQLVNKKAWLSPLRITLAKDHPNSKATFFAHWDEWTQDLADYQITVQFLWITGGEVLSTEDVKEVSRSTPHDNKIINLAYKSRRVPLSMADRNIAYRLATTWF